jgi:hypothetical protein
MCAFGEEVLHTGWIVERCLVLVIFRLSRYCQIFEVYFGTASYMNHQQQYADNLYGVSQSTIRSPSGNLKWVMWLFNPKSDKYKRIVIIFDTDIPS